MELVVALLLCGTATLVAMYEERHGRHGLLPDPRATRQYGLCLLVMFTLIAVGVLAIAARNR